MSQRSSLPSHDPLERFVPGRLHVLVGGPGTGKTALCLRFLAAGMVAGERAAMLTMMRGDDVKAHARRLGFELDDALRFERLMLIRYRADFGERRARAASPIQAVEELERLLAHVQPSRIVIDSFAPLLGDEPGGGHAVAALAGYLERSGATSLLTYPEDVSKGYDRRLEPVMQSAAAILRLERRSQDRIDLHALTTRAAGPIAGGDADHARVALTS
jgi:KaiC/GvpD/RAD55 family RecA-like ATPase